MNLENVGREGAEGPLSLNIGRQMQLPHSVMDFDS